MFRIYRIFDDSTSHNKKAIRQVQAILRKQFPLLSPKEVDDLPLTLRDPLKSRLRTFIFVSETNKEKVNGFAIMNHASDLGFCYLDFLSAAFGKTGRGVGGILYEQVRREAKALGVHGLYYECLPDDPQLSPDPEILRQNAARLSFYERYGARPIVGTAYETPIREGQTNPPFLVFDDLDGGLLPSRGRAKAVVRAILERKYSAICTPAYIDMVVESIRDDPVRLRPFKYRKKSAAAVVEGVSRTDLIPLVVSEGHAIHHVHDRGYVESPVRIDSILRQIEPTGLFSRERAVVFGEKHILGVHDAGYVNYFKRLCRNIRPDESIYPYVFPVRNTAKKPKLLSVRAGYYCIDTFTPLTSNAFEAARRAVDCALTGANFVLSGYRTAYALVRPPGHHAERSVFGGFCYFNSTAVAANFLSAFGRVAILDIDHHHGNGQQDIFYHRKDVLTVSIHGHPNVTYPYFSGFFEERGVSRGYGYNINIPLPEGVDGRRYADTLASALKQIKDFRPSYLVVAFGLDTAKNDPTGSWLLTGTDFERNGRLIGRLKIKTLVVQEGGYDNRSIGHNAARFFRGLSSPAG
ncbi:MAG: histone deacetylase family protein [Chitinispirillaceae bacterium]|nr:histone deacetylase family protein [Chitinispirillaceae bacterium]